MDNKAAFAEKHCQLTLLTFFHRKLSISNLLCTVDFYIANNCSDWDFIEGSTFLTIKELEEEKGTVINPVSHALSTLSIARCTKIRAPLHLIFYCLMNSRETNRVRQQANTCGRQTVNSQQTVNMVNRQSTEPRQTEGGQQPADRRQIPG